jgi:hypothetical protein
MANNAFVCPTCGYEDVKPGMCPDCNMDLDEICPDCGSPKSECVCEMKQEEEEEEK